ncbi:MAG: PQQ-binding-like beta-propeller repeat protein [Fervidobacterium sp.]
MNKTKILLILIVLISNLLFSGALILTLNGIYDEAGNIIKSGNFNDLLFDGKSVYYILSDGIYTLDGRTKIDIKSAQKIGLNYVTDGIKVYKIENGSAKAVDTIPRNVKNIYVKDDYIIGLENGQLVCYYQGKVMWSMETPATSFKVSGNYLAAFGTQTMLFNISNPQYLKFERNYNKRYIDYAYFFEYHAFSDGAKIYIYKGASMLSTTFPYRGPLFSDLQNLYSGNLMVTSDMIQKDLKITAKTLVPFSLSGTTNVAAQEEKMPSSTVSQKNQESTPSTQAEQKQIEPEVFKPTEEVYTTKTLKMFELVWKVLLNDDISGKPAVKGDNLYIPTLKGTVVNISQGKIVWTFKAGFVIVGHVTIGNNVYAVSWDDTIYALNEDGVLNWKIKLDGDISQGPAWDGYYLYVVTDNGTVYVIRDDVKSAKITNTYKTAAYPILPPSVSLAGKIFVIDGFGNLWKDKSTVGYIGKLKNLPILYENYYLTQELGFSLIDEVGVLHQFIPLEKETQILKGKANFITVNDIIVDAVLGKEYIYALSNSGKLYVIGRDTKKVVFTDNIPNAKYLSLSNKNLYVFGKEVRCYFVNDNPSGLWNSLYANQFNWNSAVK